MFDKNTIAQLSQLKEDIKSSTDYAEGVVIGANGRFGFVKTDDHRSAFLSPERMQRVLPGDRVKVIITTNDKKKPEAEIEALLEQGLTKFVGYYRVKGNNHFVEADGSSSSRWIFIPPQFRKQCKEGELVYAELHKHPYEDGKASAKVIRSIGFEGDEFFHHNKVMAQFELDINWSKDAQQQAEDTAANIDLSAREDFSELPFVTIDSPSTRDMDDAVYGETNTDGSYQLYVAIADPASFLLPGSPITKTARFAAQSVYLPAKTIPMLPEVLATETFSLTENVIRPTLICSMTVSTKGEITQSEFKYARAKSHKKLNYREVAPFIEDESLTQSQNILDSSEEIKESLRVLNKLTLARLKYRSEHNQVNENPADYDFRIDAMGLIEGITKRERNAAHRLIEEAMLSTNISAGNFLAEHNVGVFSAQAGFREDRLGEVKSMLREDLDAEDKYENVNTLDGHLALINRIKTDAPLILAPLKRMMQPAEVSLEPLPHLNLGVAHYATVTSPIRRYADLCNHWCISQILAGKKAKQAPQKVVEQLRETLNKIRLANRQLELTLIGHFLLGNGDESQSLVQEGENQLHGEAEIRIVTQQGFGVRMLENGIEGFIQPPKGVDRVSDAKRMTLTINGQCFRLGDTVNVKAVSVDLAKRRVQMELVDGFAPKPEAVKESAEIEGQS